MHIDPVRQAEEAVDVLCAQMNGAGCTRLEVAGDRRFIICESFGFNARRLDAARQREIDGWRPRVPGGPPATIGSRSPRRLL